MSEMGKLCASDIYLSHWSTVDGSRLTFKPGADVVHVSNQSFNDAAALLVDQQLALWALDGVVTKTLATDSTQILAWFRWNIKVNTGNYELGLLHVDMEPSMPWVWDTLLLGVRDKHQAICIEQLPCTVREQGAHSPFWPVRSSRCEIGLFEADV